MKSAGFLIVVLWIFCTSASAALPPELQQQLRLLREGDTSQRQEAVQFIASTGDPTVLPYLGTALKTPAATDVKTLQEYENVRRDIVMAIARSFPDQAFPFFRDLLESGTPAQRQAAVYGLGQVEDPTAIDLVLPLFSDPDDGLRRSAVLATVRYAHTIVKVNAAHMMGRGRPLTDVERAALEKITDRAIEAITTPGVPIRDGIYRLLWRLADHEVTRTTLDNYVDRLPASRAGIGRLLQRLQQVNRSWLGRPQTSDFDHLSYEVVLNHKGADSDPMPIRATPSEMKLLRFVNVYLDRTVNLELPIDGLVSFPQLLEPISIEGNGGTGRATLNYTIAHGVRLNASIGGLDRNVWNDRPGNLQQGRLTVDTVRGVPLREELFAPDGRMVAEVHYDDYSPVGGGPLAPRRIEISMLESSTTNRHLRYELNYQIKDGQWILDHGRVFEVKDDEEILRASNRVQNLRIEAPLQSSGP